MQRKTVAPMQVLFATQELTIPEVGVYAERHGRELMEAVETYGLQSAGPWLFVSYNLPRNETDRYTMDFCLPISNAQAYTGERLSVKQLGSFPCASLVYDGVLRDLFTGGYRPLIEQITAANLNLTGESREVYHAWHGPESHENRIEIQFGVV